MRETIIVTSYVLFLLGIFIAIYGMMVFRLG